MFVKRFPIGEISQTIIAVKRTISTSRAGMILMQVQVLVNICDVAVVIFLIEPKVIIPVAFLHFTVTTRLI